MKGRPLLASHGQPRGGPGGVPLRRVPRPASWRFGPRKIASTPTGSSSPISLYSDPPACVAFHAHMCGRRPNVCRLPGALWTLTRYVSRVDNELPESTWTKHYREDGTVIAMPKTGRLATSSFDGRTLMISSRDQSEKRRYWQRKGAVVAAALLILTIGLCLFHGTSTEHDGHGMSPDLCAGVVMVLAGTVVLIRPVINGWLVPVPKRFLYVVSRDLLDRPPELLLSF